jgi:Fe-S cluster assembly ATPase SufC
MAICLLGLNPETENALIAVLGPTGAGKSTFNKAITGHDVKVGHGLLSG